jgi:DNA polymerase-1
MASQPRLYLIDGHALAYRTYFALTGASGSQRWITPSGEPTAGTYGFVSVLLRLLEQELPEFLAVSFDTGPTFRDEIYEEYKATRDKMPEDLRVQIDRIREIIAAFGIPILDAEGYEADDVLGTVAKLAAAQGVQVTILTGDRDLLQLADENITIRLAGQKLSEAVDYSPEQVEERYGLAPERLVEYKAMIGDKSDNIPGVYGVGEKTALKLLKKFKDLDGIYKNLDKVSSRFRSKLEQSREQAYLSQTLSRIVTDVPIEFDLEACRARGYDRDKVVELFRQLDFRSLQERLPSPGEETKGTQMSLFVSREESVPEGPEQVTIVDDGEKLARLRRELEAADRIAFDVETTSTDAMQAGLVGISLAVQPGEGYYIPVGHHRTAAAGPQLQLDEVLDALRGPMTDSKHPKVGHNLKYDFLVLARHGLAAKPLTFDTMLAEWICNPASRNLGLKNLAWARLGFEMTEISELIGTGRNQRTMAEVPITEVASYAAADAEVCLRLMPLLSKELEEKNGQGLLEDLEMPLVPVLADMERTGILLDTDFLEDLSSSLAERLDEIEQAVYKLAGRPFNLNSTQQLSQVLFDELELTPPNRTRRTSSGYYSTAAWILEELREAHPIVEHILEYRELSKIHSTYAEAFPHQVNPVTGRVHTSYNQTGSVTGRLASSDPNLQNIPVRTELGRQIRRAFVAAPGQLLLSVDYSQIELRIVAHMAEDQSMIEAFHKDQDIHATTASAVFGGDPEEITPDQRRRAKAVNFGLIYGMSPYGLSRSTDLTLAEAENFVETYFERFPGVKRYLDETRQIAAERGFVETLLGRRRYFPQLMRSAQVSENARSRAEREAINAPIQGTAADIIKLAMLRLPQALDQAGLSAKMLLQVHDELVFECPANELEDTVRCVKQVMRAAYELRVPLKTDAKAGPNWAKMRIIA